MTDISERVEKLTADFKREGDWEARYRQVIDLGKSLPEMSNQFRNDTFKVKGCQSQVWLHASLAPDGRIRFVGDSDAMIVRGLVACLIKVYDGATPEEVLSTSPRFLNEIGFDTHLSPSRANGLNSMVKQIYLYATAFKALAANR